MTKFTIMTDQEIAHRCEMLPIIEVANRIGIEENDLECYGKYKAKIPLKYIRPDKFGKLILVSAMTPTPAGEGKTTVSIGLSEGLNRIGQSSIVALREPSLGPVFGIKGGATGGGYSQVVPMEDINLHFTGDFAAVEKTNNLLAAIIDNNLQSKTRSLGIDPRTVVWKRVADMSDRALRNIVIGLGGTGSGVPRESGFNITAASEIMAILCISKDIQDMKERFGNIFVGFTYDKKPVFARDLNVQGAMAALMKDAIKPNLVQTLEGTPALIHGGPFANIAQGTNSIIATKMALSLSDYTVTEAGFGFDLGGEKFMDIKCRYAGIAPSAVVLVATVRALKYHGGKGLRELSDPDTEALRKGLENLEKHVENVRQFNLPLVVAVNRFSSDTDEEIQTLKEFCNHLQVPVSVANVWGDGGKGAEDLAKRVVEICEAHEPDLKTMYDLDDTIERKIGTIAKKIYGAAQVEYSLQGKRALKRAHDLGLDRLCVCIAKTQNSLSDNPKLLGRPRDFELTVNDIEIASGAGFIIPVTGSILRMPGLPSIPASENMDIDNDGNITGLF